MNDTEIDMAIADACNWSFLGLNRHAVFCTGDNYVGCPTRDLNAMHEAENTLSDDQLKSYDGWLIAIAGTRARRATAKERCDAFCLTLGIMKP